MPDATRNDPRPMTGHAKRKGRRANPKVRSNVLNKTSTQYPELLDIPAELVIPAASPTRMAAAFQKRQAEIASVPDGELAAINADVQASVVIALAYLPRLRSIRSEIEKHAPTFDRARFDAIEEYALALGYAESEYDRTSAQRRDMPGLYSRAIEMRETLLDTVKMLARFHLIDTGDAMNAGKTQGYRSVSFELSKLAHLLLANVATVEAKTPLRRASIERAGTIAEELLLGLAEREAASPEVAEAQRTRQRAFTLFVHAYDDARRVISFLRWNEGDVSTYLPSLYQGRGSGKRADDAPDEAPDEAPVAESASNVAAPASPATTSVARSAPALGSASASSTKRDSIFVPASAEPFES